MVYINNYNLVLLVSHPLFKLTDVFMGLSTPPPPQIYSEIESQFSLQQFPSILFTNHPTIKHYTV